MNLEMSVRFVLFDLGGVLFDFDHRIATRAIAPSCLCSESELFEAVFRSGLEESFDRGEIGPEEFFREVRRRSGFSGTENELEAAWNGIFQPKEDSLALVASLASAEISLGVVSNTNVSHFEALALLGDWTRHFRWFFLSFRLHARKPEPAFYSAVTRQIPFDPSEGLFVDDRAENLPPAASEGYRTVLFRGAAELERFLLEENEFPRFTPPGCSV